MKQDADSGGRLRIAGVVASGLIADHWSPQHWLAGTLIALFSFVAPWLLSSPARGRHLHPAGVCAAGFVLQAAGAVFSNFEPRFRLRRADV
jgi:hypothetical protein